MGLVYADIELINGEDYLMEKRHVIEPRQVKKIKLNMLVDSGAYMMAINEVIQSQLEVPFKDRRNVQLADGSIAEYDVVGPIEVRFKNRNATCNAFVLPGDTEPLLGAIPMEEMDVMIHPQGNELIVNPAHPNFPILKMK